MTSNYNYYYNNRFDDPHRVALETPSSQRINYAEWAYNHHRDKAFTEHHHDKASMDRRAQEELKDLKAGHYTYRVMGSGKFLTFEIEKVIFNYPATIVIWGDGSKTVVKCGPNDVYDPEKGLAMCFAKRILGNTGNYYSVLKKHLPEEKTGSVSLDDFSEAFGSVILNMFRKGSALSDHVDINYVTESVPDFSEETENE